MPCNKASEKTHSGWVLLLAVQIFWSCLTESAFGVVLAWDPSPDTNVVGYAVQYGTNSGSYQTRVDVANQTNATIQLPTNGNTFFFVAIAYTVDGVESLPSNEVSYSPAATSTNQTITFGALATKTFGAAAFSLSATASSGLPVNFSSGNPSVATIAGNTVTIVGVGSAVITASQAGNASFAAAPSKTVAFTVIDPNATVVTPVDIIPVAANGKVLYASRCSGCPGPAAAGGSKVLNGANSALTILSAIKSNLGGMGTLGALSNQDLADIAAYLATPNM